MPLDAFGYGDSELAWSPRLLTGDSLGEVISGADAAPVSANNVTASLSFSYNPTETYVLHGFTEFIELKFKALVYPIAVRIGENRGMCSLVRIQGRSSLEDAEWVDLWRASDRFTQDGLLDTAAKRAECWGKYDDSKRYRTFRPSICQQPTKMDMLRLELDTSSVTDWNEIDFVELHGSTVVPDGVLPANTSGVWYEPEPGFVGLDSIEIVPCAYSCLPNTHPCKIPASYGSLNAFDRRVRCR